MDETVLGFQLRIAPALLEPWDSTRRATYLLSDDIQSPLSVDTAVWPLSDDQALHFALFDDFDTAPNSAPNGLGLYSLRTTESYRRSCYIDGSLLVGISVVGEVAHELQVQRCIQESVTLADLSASKWTCLGYDVADWWLLSGLSNCGYDPTKRQSLSLRFAAQLNNSGLFVSISEAQSFCSDCNIRVPEHAPFAVYGIWSLAEH